MSDVEHIIRNVTPLLDATVLQADDLRVEFGEQSLKATTARRNKNRNPEERARAGFKVDAIILYVGLYWHPEIGCGEVAGGLPRYLWAVAQDELAGVDATELVMWGFTIIGECYSLVHLALAAAGGLFHLIQAYEVPLPSTLNDLFIIKRTYCTMLSFVEKLNETKGSSQQIVHGNR
ncbi:hypothetical protein BC937DRAFT_86445 [Endogone sp. FLAS-F59071]|nr:hypothetical protein BC937DRAFT_86445 [Endogone sp. FLAS-F59071]|eukprot:RUS13040.1 hypothetical protein BC937DRAFT_86445 [Endogone sp. FLAS-F59071]